MKVENSTQNSEYGEAFKKRPICLKTQEETIAFIEIKMQEKRASMRDSYSLSRKSSYKNNTVYERTDSRAGKPYLDLGFLIKDETSSLKGKLSDAKDVDFYDLKIPYNRTIQNYFTISINMQMAEGCDFNLTLYDEYGNQVGIAQSTGANQKTINIPNWDTKTSKYRVKIENADGTPITQDNYYQITCAISNNEEQKRTDPIREAFGKCHTDYMNKSESYQESLAEYNRLIREAEKNYDKEVEALHKKQYESLPKEKQYAGNKTVEQLLKEWADGAILKEDEIEYLKIFANVSAYEKAQNQASLKTECSDEFRQACMDAGIPLDMLEGMKISIESDGTVTVKGNMEEQVRDSIERIVADKFSDRLYSYYINIADSVSELPMNMYQYVTDVREVERYLKQVLKEDVAIAKLDFTSDTKIAGLSRKASQFINETQNNPKVKEIREMMESIIGIQKEFEITNSPTFSSVFQWQAGELAVVDEGFSYDIENLTFRMSHLDFGKNMYSDMYKYNKKRVL